MPSGFVSKITSAQNPLIKHVVKLRDKKERDITQTFLIEGYRELLRAIDAGVEIETLLICPEFFLGENENSLIKNIQTKKAQVCECLPFVFEKISYRDRPDGLIAIAKTFNTRLDHFIFSKPNPFIVIAVSIEKPGNLGTILRSADAVGVDLVIVVDKVTDIFNPNVVRASVGTLFTRPVVEATSQEVFDWLKKNQIQIVSTSPAAKTSYTKVDYKPSTAILVGSEQYGLPEFWLEKADQKVSIPMVGVADSLNAATSTTLVLYEVFRQRHDL